jgi:F-type H+-transporting ATPase subunit epsilon
MRLKVLLPYRVLVDENVSMVSLETEDGGIGILPKHIDMAAAVAPGIVSYTTEKKNENKNNSNEVFLGVDEGTIVKVGGEVLISVRNGVIGPDLEHLRRTIDEEFKEISHEEQKARSASSRLEASFYRRFVDLSMYEQ